MSHEGTTWENDPELPLSDESLSRAGEIVAQADNERGMEGVRPLALEETLPSHETEQDRIRRVLGPKK
jgi:hypothetical protein